MTPAGRGTRRCSGGHLVRDLFPGLVAAALHPAQLHVDEATVVEVPCRCSSWQGARCEEPVRRLRRPRWIGRRPRRPARASARSSRPVRLSVYSMCRWGMACGSDGQGLRGHVVAQLTWRLFSSTNTRLRPCAATSFSWTWAKLAMIQKVAHGGAARGRAVDRNHAAAALALDRAVTKRSPLSMFQIWTCSFSTMLAASRASPRRWRTGLRNAVRIAWS